MDWGTLAKEGLLELVNSVKFTGEVLKSIIKMATYEITHKKDYVKKEGTAVGLADGTVLAADGKIIYTAENLKVGLFKS